MEQTQQSKRPTHGIYQVRDSEEGAKGYWNRIGGAWPHKDGLGFNLQIEAIPLDGKIVLRVSSEKAE